MKVTYEIRTFYKLYKLSWSDAKITLKTIQEYHKEKELMNLLDEIFYDSVNEINLNNYLWFKQKEIFECLGIEEY